MGCVKFTYDESSGTVLMLNFRFNAMMRDLLKREMAPKPEESTKQVESVKQAELLEKGEPGKGEPGKEVESEIQYLPRFGDYLGKLERLFNITVMKTDYAPEMMLLVVYVPREELPQEEVDMRCVEYASHKLPYHTNYTGKDLNQVDRFVAMLRRQFTRIYSRANRLPFDESIWKGEYKARRIDPRALRGILGEEAIEELEAKLGDPVDQDVDKPEGAAKVYVNRLGIGTEEFLLELELKAGRKGRRRLPKFELSKSNFEKFLDRLGDITHVDFLEVFDMTVWNGPNVNYVRNGILFDLFFKFPVALAGSVFFMSLWRFAIEPAGNYLFDRLEAKRKAKPRKKPKPKKARCPAAAG
jgi:hypothetical protein